MSDIMRIGVSALHAYQLALSTSSQNIANVGTANYSRREINFTEGAFDTGVNVMDIRRVFDETANRKLQKDTSVAESWQTYYDELSRLEPLFDDETNSVGRFITESLGALKQIQNDFNANNRELFMAKLKSLSTQMQNVNNEVDSQFKKINSSLSNVILQANNLINSINSVNNKLDLPVNNENAELLDQREALIQELAKYFDFSVTADQYGKVDLVLSNGLSLLHANPPLQLKTVPDPDNDSYLKLAIMNGATEIRVDNLFTGGKIGGLLKYRDEGVAPAKVALGRLALVFSDKMNAQNKLGIDGSNRIGSNLFQDINSATMMTNRIVPNANNASVANMTAHIDNVTELQASDYKLIIGTSNSYTLTRLSDNTIVSSGTIGSLPDSVSVDGFTLNMDSGTFSTSDQYIISPTHGAADNMRLSITDSSQIALGWPVIASAGAASPGSNGKIEVTDIIDTANAAFANPLALDPPIQIRFTVSGSTTTYTIFNSDTNVAIEGPLSYDPTTGADIFPTTGGYDPGYRVKISGSNIQDGDNFNIAYNTNGISDNRNARAMAQLYDAETMLGTNGQTVTFNQGYALLSNNVSSTTKAAFDNARTATDIQSQSAKQRDNISGVSLEEETLNLSQYQAAYQASAQVLTIARSILETIIGIGR